MRWIQNDSTDPYFNMALDDWCLQRLSCDETVFYLWRNRPSVIVGITQDVSAEVHLEYLRAHGIDLVRRSTGGGAVYHDLQNLNYSFVGKIRPAGEGGPDDGVALIAQALQSFGVPAEVSGRNDIYVDGLKISGYAKRVWRDRAIVHGTLMYDVDIDTLTCVLDTPQSKLHHKGVASVRSRVGNLRDLLPFASLDSFRAALQERFAAAPSAAAGAAVPSPTAATALPGGPAEPSAATGALLAGSAGECSAAASDGRIVLSEADLAEVRAIRDTKYLNPDWLKI